MRPGDYHNRHTVPGPVACLAALLLTVLMVAAVAVQAMLAAPAPHPAIVQAAP